MSTKKTIIHFIYDLGRGGAETMLVEVVKELKEYRNIIVTHTNKNHFGPELQCDQLICLNQETVFDVPRTVFKLRRIIKKERPSFVHSHLPWPTMIARIAVPQKIPLITTIHNSVATSRDYKRWYVRFLDKLTYSWRKSTIIAVSQVSYNDYFSILKLKSYKSYVLHTFVNINRFQRCSKPKEARSKFRVVAVGSLSFQKNFSYLVDAFSQLNKTEIELHIYGKGDQQQKLQQKINETGANVILKGQVNNIQEIIEDYNLFVMSSLFEGFSLSVLEAMAMKVPLLLSDIRSFREQCKDCAVYFDLDNVDDFIKKLNCLIEDKNMRYLNAEEGYKRVIDNFTFEHHIAGLRKIYSEVLKEISD